MTARIVERHQTDHDCPICGQKVWAVKKALDTAQAQNVRVWIEPMCLDAKGRNHIPDQWEWPGS